MIKTISNVGQFGAITDKQPQEIPENAWTAATNVVFRNGSAERVYGMTNALQTPATTPLFITPFQTSLTKYAVWCSTTKVIADNGTVAYDITNLTAPTGATDDRYTGGTLNGILLLNNGVDQPQYWAGNVATKTAVLPGWNSAWRCGALRPFKNYAVALNITKSGTNYPNMVKWSDAAVPGAVPASWDETDATKSAGEQDLAETTDPLVDCLPLGDLNIIYKERSMYSMQYIGQPYIFRFQRLPGNSGILAKGCAVAIPQGHVVLTAGDVVLHAGQGTQSIINDRLRRWLFSNIDGTNYKRSFVVANMPKSEVWICIPTSGNSYCNMALVWNYVSDTWGFRTLNQVTYGATGSYAYQATSDAWSADVAIWSADTTSWNPNDITQADSRLILTTATPSGVIVDVGTDYAGTAINATLERTGMSFGDPLTVKTAKRVFPRIDAPTGTVVNIQLGGSMDVEGPVTWSNSVPYTVGSTQHADCFATGRFLAIRFTSVGGNPWRIGSYDLDIVGRGSW
jgi:hypothetical protein